jgi:Na+-transporting NADH:ubiquinone oxidoreductase subunit C
VLTVRDASGAIQVLILPVWGSGYQSTLFGYLALAGDGNTVLALKFYQHGETPGIGARIEDPNWTALWAGKQIYDERDEVRIGVAKGPVARGSSRYTHEVDGLSGATRTSDGVTNLLRYWLSDHGYGPYLKRIRRAEA